jgi:hypothetical protein
VIPRHWREHGEVVLLMALGGLLGWATVVRDRLEQAPTHLNQCCQGEPDSYICWPVSEVDYLHPVPDLDRGTLHPDSSIRLDGLPHQQAAP